MTATKSEAGNVEKRIAGGDRLQDAVHPHEDAIEHVRR